MYNSVCTWHTRIIKGTWDFFFQILKLQFGFNSPHANVKDHGKKPLELFRASTHLHTGTDRGAYIDVYEYTYPLLRKVYTALNVAIAISRIAANPFGVSDRTRTVSRGDYRIRFAAICWRGRVMFIIKERTRVFTPWKRAPFCSANRKLE